MPYLDNQARAIAGAHQAAIGAAELARYAHEGEAFGGGLEDETVEKLADALKLAIEIDLADPDGAKERLYDGVVKFLEGWVG